ncbi:2-hydroxychromene-2-carboxylate isomerase [Massilia sp. TSP1-1-2]|uniref:2-hydroxychromene-2-carboxylate isomerase n=1 Tax=Massilia sp. TSP1-1-2 TaxID=2804649 RepID=UPI003CE810B2
MDAHRTLEFWFDFGSNYSYLAMLRVEALAAQRDVRVVLKPFLLGPIFKSFGWESSPFVLQAKKGAYTWRDMERQCAKYGLPWNKPSVFPRRALLPMRVAIAAEGQPWLGQFCRRIMHANFVDDREIDDAATVTEVLAALQLAPDAWITLAQEDATKAALRAQSTKAAARGIFGAPTFFVGDEMFWGNDRLEDALEYARGRRRFAPIAPAPD